jgi:indole-3-pyruvate monooxygenase
LFSADGFPRADVPCNWKGNNGLYSAGFGRKGLVGTSMDAQRIAADIHKLYNQKPIVKAPPPSEGKEKKRKE